MRGRARALVFAAALLGSGLPKAAWAQGLAQSPVASPDPPERFVGLDLFAGGAAFQLHEQPRAGEETNETRYAAAGWEAGATVSFGRRWLGIAGAAGRQTIETVPVHHVVVGPRVTSPWLPVFPAAVRGFAHALVGVAGTSGAAGSQNSAEWVIGVGADVWLIRVQIDYVRLTLAGLPNENYRAFVGGVVPLCLRACRGTDGFNVSGRQASK